MIREKEQDKPGGRQGHPPVRAEDAVRLQLGEKIAPARNRLPDAQPEERQRDLRKNELRDEKRGHGQHNRVSLRDDMPPQDVQIGSAHGARRQHKGALSRAERDSANQACRAGPARESHHANQQKESVRGPDVQRENRPHGKQQIEPGQGQKKFEDAHQDGVGPTPVKARERSQERTHEKRNGRSQGAGKQRNAPAEEHARKFVSSEIIGAKEKNPSGWVHAEKMKTRAPASDDGIRRTLDKEAKREATGKVFLIRGSVVFHRRRLARASSSFRRGPTRTDFSLWHR